MEIGIVKRSMKHKHIVRLHVRDMRRINHETFAATDAGQILLDDLVANKRTIK